MPLLRSTLLAAFAGIFLGLSAAPHEVPFGPVLFAPLFGVALGLAPPIEDVRFDLGVVLGRLTNAPGDAFAPVPAFPDRTRVEDGRVVFDAGDGLYVFDPAARTVKPR